MDADRLLRRFDGRTRLLFQSLLSGVQGSSRAVRLFHRQRRSDPDISLRACLDTLCMEEPHVGDKLNLSLTPLVCLFPVAFKCGLLSFLHLIYPLVPGTCLIRLLDCLKQDPAQDPWIHVLLAQLCRDLGLDDPLGGELYSAHCRTKLEQLCQRLGNSEHSALSLGSAFDGASPTRSSQEPVGEPDLQLHGKRRNEASEVAESQSKKMRLDLPATQEDDGKKEALPSQAQDVVQEAAARTAGDVRMLDFWEPQQSFPEGTSVLLPEHIRASVTRIKELLETTGEWVKDSASVLEVLMECEPPQVELLCAELQLSEIPEQTLPRLCSGLLSLCPDLSQCTATLLTRSLFFKKVLSLRDPASRSLLSAVTSFGRRYPRPACSALISPILQSGQINRFQADLLCRLIEGCLEPQYQLLIFGEMLVLSWSEEVLSVVHSLLDSKLELTEELFSQFITRLRQQAPDFTKSMTFAKMVMGVLNKYPRFVSPHKHMLSCCLASHETFLKKSLLAALKRIDPS
ncbi:Fanconi anemia group E protein isoform X2 [Brienomyrus brachyistius]|uniref:Fanconi anemia group E protein isoform X2 n=1 Tax=Brienomyrus brachyistius TaxID=42636 RepID=UPI0020B1C277|nr:Fanconi anemia group E protein isoform X2 [Brienomyrus brachyistius]